METSRKRVKVRRKDICYIRYTLESYDGMAVVSTLDPKEALIEVRIAPGCEEAASRLLESLKRDEGIEMEPFSEEKE